MSANTLEMDAPAGAPTDDWGMFNAVVQSLMESHTYTTRIHAHTEVVYGDDHGVMSRQRQALEGAGVLVRYCHKCRDPIYDRPKEPPLCMPCLGDWMKSQGIDALTPEEFEAMARDAGDAG